MDRRTAVASTLVMRVLTLASGPGMCQPWGRLRACPGADARAAASPRPVSAPVLVSPCLRGPRPLRPGMPALRDRAPIGPGFPPHGTAPRSAPDSRFTGPRPRPRIPAPRDYGSRFPPSPGPKGEFLQEILAPRAEDARIVPTLSHSPAPRESGSWPVARRTWPGARGPGPADRRDGQARQARNASSYAWTRPSPALSGSSPRSSATHAAVRRTHSGALRPRGPPGGER